MGKHELSTREKSRHLHTCMFINSVFTINLCMASEFDHQCWCVAKSVQLVLQSVTLQQTSYKLLATLYSESESAAWSSTSSAYPPKLSYDVTKMKTLTPWISPPGFSFPMIGGWRDSHGAWEHEYQYLWLWSMSVRKLHFLCTDWILSRVKVSGKGVSGQLSQDTINSHYSATLCTENTLEISS